MHYSKTVILNAVKNLSRMRAHIRVKSFVATLLRMTKFIFFYILNSTFYIPSALAARPAGGFGLEETAEAAKLIQSAQSPPAFGIATIAGTVVGYLLAFVGVIFFVLMLYGGFLWMTSRGNEEQVKKAVGIIRSAVIGIIIVFASYVITRLVVTKLTGAAGI